MDAIDPLLEKYGLTHQHPANRRIHFACVPAIVFSTVGLGWAVHAGLFVDAPGAHALNLGAFGTLLALAWYARLGRRAVAWMAGFLAASNAVFAALAAAGAPILALSAGIWAAAWVLQFVGHHFEGAKPSFTDDLVFLLVGPLFVLDEWGVRVRPESRARALAA